MHLSPLLWNDYKHGGDLIFASLTLGAVLHFLPAISAVLSIVWVCIRIYETDTVQRLIGRK